MAPAVTPTPATLTWSQAASVTTGACTYTAFRYRYFATPLDAEVGATQGSAVHAMKPFADGGGAPKGESGAVVVAWGAPELFTPVSTLLLSLSAPAPSQSKVLPVDTPPK